MTEFQTDPAAIPVTRTDWPAARRIIRSLYPPIDLFEDIADPEDWPLLMSAEQKTNPRLAQTIGNLDLVPPARRVGGEGASYLMAPFTHTSTDRPSRFSDGRLGVLYIAEDFETAVQETAHHHARFMAATDEVPGWTSQFRELVLRVGADLHDIRGSGDTALLGEDYAAPQALAAVLRGHGADGILYPSVRGEGACVGLFYPDLAHDPRQGRHLDYHWNGDRVDMIRDTASGDIFRLIPPER
ncbi:RES family NAD+ phosphorylase [Pseudooceanicola nanhaiensis]|uniref:RES family NAD+ phosphorylase n=1 Tax=Pseudooceanicola nanhaiensis TaxID=375761 RepID=UPI001CD41308|nr:RES family NAD+ phosphorylase [Pseudooceanicola nanhaiensis]MCA0922935.1 RES family NAD+ phosphorylase [Pseudooceanicola nanhaiensis]